MTTQLRMLDPAPRSPKVTKKLDRRTREVGLKGVAQAREALRRATTRSAA